jgi:uncharacterized membrane protein YbhN (UPF0104 family)
VYYYFVSGFFNNFAPANLAGDALRVSVLYRQGQDGIAVTGSIILERLLSLIGLALICSWALVSQPMPIIIQALPNMILVTAILFLAGIIALKCLWRHLPTRLKVVFVEIKSLWGSVRGHPGQFGRSIVITMLIHFVTMLITFGSLQAVSIHLSIPIQLAVYSIAGLLLALPVTIQGVGIREGVYINLLGLVGVDAEHVLAAMALNYIILILLSVCGGILFWRSPYQLGKQVG